MRRAFCNLSFFFFPLVFLFLKLNPFLYILEKKHTLYIFEVI